MSKTALIERIREILRSRLQSARVSASEAREAATGDEVKSEGKYDTRGVEASYLASAQARLVAELGETLAAFTSTSFPSYSWDAPVAAGALVEIDHAGERQFFLLAPAGGGLTIEHDGCDLHVLTPGAPLRRQLEGLRAGDPVGETGMIVLGVS